MGILAPLPRPPVLGPHESLPGMGRLVKLDRRGVCAVTRDEGDRIDKLAQNIADLTIEVRVANSGNALEIDHIKTLCEERHGGSIERMQHLERSERKTYGLRNKLAGMTAPAAVLVSIVALIINFMR